MKKPICEYCKGYAALIRDTNHTIGCNLEAIADVLRYRGMEKEAGALDKIAAGLK